MLLSPGGFLFIAGAGMMALAFVLSLVMLATEGKRKQKMDERMRERY